MSLGKFRSDAELDAAGISTRMSQVRPSPCLAQLRCAPAPVHRGSCTARQRLVPAPVHRASKHTAGIRAANGHGICYVVDGRSQILVLLNDTVAGMNFGSEPDQP